MKIKLPSGKEVTANISLIKVMEEAKVNKLQDKEGNTLRVGYGFMEFYWRERNTTYDIRAFFSIQVELVNTNEALSVQTSPIKQAELAKNKMTLIDYSFIKDHIESMVKEHNLGSLDSLLGKFKT